MPKTPPVICPSTRTVLKQGWSCRQVGGKGWAIYWMEGGYELTLYPGGEGPQEMADIDEAIAALGGDMLCELTPASMKRLAAMNEVDRAATIALLREGKSVKPQAEHVKASVNLVPTGRRRILCPHGDESSATAGDYWFLPPGYAFTCEHHGDDKRECMLQEEVSIGVLPTGADDMVFGRGWRTIKRGVTVDDLRAQDR